METITKTKLSKKEQIKLLQKIDIELSRTLNNISWTPYYKNYFKNNLKEERNHRKYQPSNVLCGITAYQSALLFAIQQIVDYFVNTKNKPCFEGYIYCRKTMYEAYSLVKTYTKQIKQALEKIDNYREVLNFDYCELIK